MNKQFRIVTLAAGFVCGLTAAPPRAEPPAGRVDFDRPGGTLIAPPGELGADLRRLRLSMGAPKELFELSGAGRKPVLTIRQEQWDKLYLFSATMEKGTGERGVYSAEAADTFLCYFHRTGDKIQFLRRNTRFRADAGTPEAKAAANSYSDAVLTTVLLPGADAGTPPPNVPATEIFLVDLLNVAARLKAVYPSPELRLSEKDSVLEKIAVFQRNLEVQAKLVFSRQDSFSSTLPDGRLLPVTMHYSMTALPEPAAFETRAADERVGYFETSYEDLSRPGLKSKWAPLVDLANRWRLEKKDPESAVSDVKAPIVYWLDDTVPHAHRPALRRGILAWNAAFEAVGLRGAIVVKEVDKDMGPKERAAFDPGDAAYNVVRWFMGEGASFAQGPSRVDPMTGEIFNVSIRVGDLMSRGGLAARELAGVRSGVDGERLSQQRAAAAALSLLEARGTFSPEEKKRFLDQYLTSIMAHEVGHTLGLRHNFKGSSSVPADPGEEGLLTASVMDYMPANIADPGKPQGPYYQTRLGPYDFWAIEYGYKPLSGDPKAKAAQLAAIAARSGADPRLAYGTDEDASGLDPDAQRFTMGPDPVDFARRRTGLVRRLWKTLENRRPAGEEGYADLRRSFAGGFGAYFGAVEAVLPVIGGVRTSRLRPGQGKDPVEPVAAAEQRAALQFLDQGLFSDEPFAVSPAVLRRLGPEDPGSEVLFPLSEWVAVLRRSALNELYQPSRLRRLAEGRLYASGPGGTLSVGEMMARVRQSVWGDVETGAPSSIALLRRDLQREHAAVLARTLEDQNAHPDARAAARRDLARVSREARAALKAPGLDAATRLHLEDVRRFIDRKLEGKP